MKKIQIFAAMAAAALGLSACNESTGVLDATEGSIDINFNLPQATRADAQGQESTLTDVQMILFNSSDELYKYHELTAAEISAKEASLSSVLAGSYTLYVIANGPDLSSCTSLAALKATAIKLESYNGSASDFIMEGHDEVTVTGGGTADADVALSRYVSRVVLKKVINSIPEAYGTFTLARAYLINAVAAQNLEGSLDPGATAANWYNKEGRKDEATRNEDHVIDGSTYTASAADLTFAGISQAITNGGNYATAKYFYAYPNSATTTISGFHSTFAAQRTALVIEGSYGGHTYYYPVVLTNGLARNTSYEVTATITGAGSDDPAIPVSNGSISLTITVENWLDGTSYTETF